jgi:hypothetical protein
MVGDPTVVGGGAVGSHGSVAIFAATTAVVAIVVPIPVVVVAITVAGATVVVLARWVSYPVFIPKPSIHHIHGSGSIVPHIRSKVFTDNQMSRIKYDYYYINSVSKDYDDSQWNRTAEDSITPHERQLGQHVA